MTFKERLRPAINIAITTTVAVIWEDIIDTIPEEHMTPLVADIVAAGTVTVLTLLVCCFLHGYPKTHLVELIQTGFKTLTGWMWKAVVGEIIKEVHEPIADKLGNPPNGTSDHDNNSRIFWTCSLSTLGVAVGTTVVGFLLLRLLPAAAPPSGYNQCGQVVSCHLCAVLVGAVTLPVAFGWHSLQFHMSQTVLGPVFQRDPVTSWTQTERWALLLAMMIAVAILSLLVLGSLRGRLAPCLAAIKKRDPAHGARYEATVLKTLDFFIAWDLCAPLRTPRSRCRRLELPALNAH
jgi:hypothetical protein